MLAPGDWVTVGIDNGGTANNGTVLDSDGRFLVDTMAELPSLVREGPDKAIAALVDSFDKVLAMTVGAEGPGARGRARHARSGQRGRRPDDRRRDQLRPPGLVQVRHQEAPSRTGSASPSSTTTTATPPRSTPTTCGTARRRRGARLGLRDRRHRLRRRRDP